METKIKVEEEYKPLTCKLETNASPIESLDSLAQTLIKQERDDVDVKNMLHQSPRRSLRLSAVTINPTDYETEPHYSPCGVDDRDQQDGNQHNSTLYCYKCGSKETCCNHLKQPHKTNLVPPQPQMTQNSLDQEDRSYYCKRCESNFDSINIYREHLWSAHIKTPSTSKNIKSNKSRQQDSDTTSYKPSNLFKNSSTSRTHLLQNQKARFSPYCVNPNTLHEQNGPKNYCNRCKFTFTTIGDYYRHLNSTHDIIPTDKFRSRIPSNKIAR